MSMICTRNVWLDLGILRSGEHVAAVGSPDDAKEVVIRNGRKTESKIIRRILICVAVWNL